MTAPISVTVSAAQLVRHFGELRSNALQAPIFISHHGRRTHVLLSAALFETLSEDAGDQGAILQDAKRLRILIEQVDACLVVLDEATRVVSLNTAALGYFSGLTGFHVGMSCATDLPELTGGLADAHLKRALKHGERASFDMPSASHDGLWLRCSIFPFGSGAAFMFRNISAERQSQSCEQRLESLQDALDKASSLGRAELTLRGTFGEVSAGMARLLGLEPERLRASRFTEILPLGHRANAVPHLEAVLQGNGARAFETALLTNDGSERPVMMSLAPIHLDHGVTGATLIVSALHGR